MEADEAAMSIATHGGEAGGLGTGNKGAVGCPALGRPGQAPLGLDPAHFRTSHELVTKPMLSAVKGV